MTVCAVCAAWFTRKTPVQQIESMGGKILFDHAFRIYESRGPIPYPADPAEAENSEVTGVNFDAQALTNADLATFVRIAESNDWEIERLTIRGTTITDIEPLAKLTDLLWLDVGRTQVIDLTPLHNLNELGVLYVEQSQVDQASIEIFQQNLPRCAVYYSRAKSP